MKFRLLALLAVVCLAGCATPKKNLTREEWLTMTTHTFKDTTVDEVLKAAEKVVVLSDAPNDISFQHYPTRMTAQRKWMYFAVIADAFGTYSFDVSTTQQDGNVIAQLYIGETTQIMGAFPTYTPGVQSGGGMGVTGSAMPVNVGVPIENPEAYNFFYGRLESLLYSKEWITCQQAIKAKAKQAHPTTYDPSEYYNNAYRAYDTLCFMADDKIPVDIKVSGK